MLPSQRNAFWLLPCALLFFPEPSPASTVITNTRAEVSFMAALWEADTVQISPLANAQYPQFTSDWEYIFPHSSLSDDLDIHIDLAVDSSGYGSTNNNIGVSPIIAEVINATSARLKTLRTYAGSRSSTRGVFRFWTEHASERHFELHPVTDLGIWNGIDLSPAFDYRPNINFVADGTTHPNSVLIALLSGSQTMTASVSADNEHVAFTYPSPSVNYVQYVGVTASPLLSDAVSLYFLLRPNLVPTAIVRCRILTNTVAAATAAALTSNQTVSVNALTRTDMLSVSNQLVALTASHSKTFPRPVELITLGIAIAGAPTNRPPIIVAQWNFNSDPPDANTGTGRASPSVGTGTASPIGGVTARYFTGSGSDPAAIGNDNSGLSLSSFPTQGTGNKQAGIRFTASTAGTKNVVISWDQQISPTASAYSRLQYSTNRIDFADFPSPVVMNNTDTFGPHAADLSDIPGVNDNTDFAFRIVTEFESSAAGTGNSNYVTASTSSYDPVGRIRLDVVTVTGTLIAATLTAASDPVSVLFQLKVSGVAGSSYVLEGSPNLSDWMPLATNVAPFTFNAPPSGPTHFFRAVYAP